MKGSVKRMSRIWKCRRRQDRRTRHTSPPALPLSLSLSLSPRLTSPLRALRVVFTEAAHTAQAGPQPTEWLQLLHINTATETIGRRQREKMDGAAPFCSVSSSRPPPSKLPGGSRARNPLAHPGPALWMLAPAVPPNAGHNLVQNKKNNTQQTDIPPPCWVAVTVQTPRYWQGNRTQPPQPHHRQHVKVHQPHHPAPRRDTWQAGLLHGKGED